MKTNKIQKGLLAISGLLGISLFLSCERDDLYPEYPFEVTVKTLADSIPAGNVFVEAYAPGPGNDQAWFYGFTDQEGRVRFQYDKQATLTIRASRGKKPDYTWIGCNEVRLLPNEVVKRTLYIEPYDSLLVGCEFDSNL